MDQTSIVSVAAFYWLFAAWRGSLAVCKRRTPSGGLGQPFPHGKLADMDQNPAKSDHRLLGLVAFVLIGSMVGFLGGYAVATFIIGGLIMLVVSAIIVYRRKEKLRTDGIRAVADQLSLQFDPQGDKLIPEFARFKLFSQGGGKKIRTMLHGTTEAVEVSIFDYQFTQDGEDGQILKQTVASFRSPHLDLPDFDLRPEHFLHKFVLVLGYQDIDFESNPDFSKAFLLRGSDEARIRAVFDDEVLALFEQTTGVCVEGDGDRLIYYRSGQRVEPANIRSFMDEGFKVYVLFRSRTSTEQPGGESTTDERRETI
jgi:hypothetical protein